MPDAVDETISKLHNAGASDDEITQIIKEKFGPGMLSRFGSGVAANANPVAMLAGLSSMVQHPVDTYNGLVDKSAENFTEAKRLLDKGEYGHALHHGIAAVIPPYNVVTHAGDELRAGNVAGGLGEAVGAGLSAKAPGLVKAVAEDPALLIKAPIAAGKATVNGAKATLDLANKAAVGGANIIENNPAISTLAGAGLGYMHSGAMGALEGATGGGVLPRLLKMAQRVGNVAGEDTAPAVAAPKVAPSALVKSTEPGMNTPQGLQSILDELRQAPEQTPGSSLPPESALPAGYEDQIKEMTRKAGRAALASSQDEPVAAPTPPSPSNAGGALISGGGKAPSLTDTLLSALEDARKSGTSPDAVELPPSSELPPAYQAQVKDMAAKADRPAPVATPPPVAPSAPPPVVPQTSQPFVPTKADVARITAMDKELGAKETARALRHDPRFAGTTHAERMATVRALSLEKPNTLPAGAMKAIDVKFNAVAPAERATYAESWKSLNPAVYNYLLTKLQ